MRKVPVFRTVADAFEFWRCNIGLFVRQAWYWTLFIFAAQIAVVHSDISVWIADYVEANLPFLKKHFFARAFVVENFETLMAPITSPAEAIAVGLFATTWQRALLSRRETPGIFPVWPAKQSLNAVGYMALYIGVNWAWLFLAPPIVMWLAYEPFWGWFVAPVSLAGLFLLYVYAARILLAVPAAATEDRYASLYEAYATSVGNSWRLFAIVLICSLFSIIPGLVIQTPDTYFTPGWAHYQGDFNYLVWYLRTLINFAAMAIILAAIAIAYRTLVSDERREELRVMAEAPKPIMANSIRGNIMAIVILLAVGLAAAWAILN